MSERAAPLRPIATLERRHRHHARAAVIPANARALGRQLLDHATPERTHMLSGDLDAITDLQRCTRPIVFGGRAVMQLAAGRAVLTTTSMVASPTMVRDASIADCHATPAYGTHDAFGQRHRLGRRISKTTARRTRTHRHAEQANAVAGLAVRAHFVPARPPLRGWGVLHCSAPCTLAARLRGFSGLAITSRDTTVCRRPL